jgi:hypothetical protein
MITSRAVPVSGAGSELFCAGRGAVRAASAMDAAIHHLVVAILTRRN